MAWAYWSVPMVKCLWAASLESDRHTLRKAVVSVHYAFGVKLLHETIGSEL